MLNEEEIQNLTGGIPRVENMESLNGYNKIANQFIIRGDDWVLFQSYNSPIALIKKGQTYIFKAWDYSRTTGKYRNNFLGESKAETLSKIKSGEYIAVDFEVEE
jgi:hypothetical protein